MHHPQTAVAHLIWGDDMDKTDLRFLDKSGKYGILKAKITGNLADGVKQGFILTLPELKKVINKIER